MSVILARSRRLTPETEGGKSELAGTRQKPQVVSQNSYANARTAQVVGRTRPANDVGRTWAFRNGGRTPELVGRKPETEGSKPELQSRRQKSKVVARIASPCARRQSWWTCGKLPSEGSLEVVETLSGKLQNLSVQHGATAAKNSGAPRRVPCGIV